MKRFFIALALLAGIITSTACTSFTAAQKLKETSAAVLRCSEAEQNEKLDTKNLKQAVSVWEKNRHFLFAVTFHDDFSEIEEKMTMLRYYSSHPDFAESSKISYESGLMLSSLAEDFYVTLENIF